MGTSAKPIPTNPVCLTRFILSQLFYFCSLLNAGPIELEPVRIPLMAFLPLWWTERMHKAHLAEACCARALRNILKPGHSPT